MLDSLVEVFRYAIEITGDIWRFRVATIDGNPLTIANITIALLVFVIGISMARRVSKWLVSKVISKAHISQNGQTLLETLIFYALTIIFLLVSLDVAQIPIKVFAVLGGALAIGVGFGSQNIIKDFISGLILMIEQPVRVGDMVEIDAETRGKVMRIGAISTHILTFRNVDVLVPNSSLIENNVINWTLSSNKAKRLISVGVAYGSPTRKVEELLVQAAMSVEQVLEERRPQAYFVGFGDNTLNFEVYFWIHMNRPGDERAIASEIRHRIVEVFEKESITIAFPQRDVHLDITHPVEVKIAG